MFQSSTHPHPICPIVRKSLLALAICFLLAGSAAFAVPFAPTPGDGDIDVPVAATLEWNASSAAEGFSVWLWPAAETAPDDPTTSGLAVGSYTVPQDLEYGTEYLWKVAENDGTNLTFGPVWSFTTLAQPPAPYGPIPADGALNVPVTMTLQWNASSAAESYGLWLWAVGDAEPDDPTTFGLTQTAYKPATELQYATQYNWQVMATYDNAIVPGPLWSFTTAIETPYGFMPADATTGVAIDTSLSWQASTGATEYDLYFWRMLQAKPSVPTTSGLTVTEWTPPTALEYDTYFWQIVARNETQSAAGPVLSFSTTDKIAGFGDWIEHFYMQVLGRPSEAGAVQAWKTGYYDAAVQSDIDVRFVARELGRLFFLSEEYDGRGRTDEDFIRDCYMTFLLRDPMQWEVNAWLDDVTTPGGPVRWNRGEVMTMFAESLEFEVILMSGTLFPNLDGNATRNFVTTMYIGVFDRLVDQGGLEYWASVMDAAKAENNVLQAAKDMASKFFYSPEGLAKAPTSEARVERLYRAFLGRFPADGEVLYWTEELESGRQTLDKLIGLFGDSDEFQGKLDRYFK